MKKRIGVLFVIFLMCNSYVAAQDMMGYVSEQREIHWQSYPNPQDDFGEVKNPHQCAKVSMHYFNNW